MTKIVALLAVAATLSLACAAELPANDDDVATSEAAQSVKPTCPVPEPARKGAPGVPNASAAAKLAAWRASVDQYAIDAARLDAAAEEHAAEYSRVSKPIVGNSCVVDADCSTGNAKYAGSCARYVWTGNTGSCQVSDLAPVAGAPGAPPLPRFTCADVTCPSSFQCEVEASTGAVGCVEPRTCIPAGKTGGGGGRNGGRP